MAHSSKNQHLTTSRGAALYIGALLGPGLLLLPGLAAAEAGPASILAWLALLILSCLFAAVFSALGRHNPSAGGVIGYVTAGLGPRAGLATGWMFLAGVVCGAPIVYNTMINAPGAPKGGKAKLFSISKRGNVYLRKILIHGARAAVLRIKRDRAPIGAWLDALDARAPKNIVIVAMANKLARIAWAVLSSGNDYRPAANPLPA